LLPDLKLLFRLGALLSDSYGDLTTVLFDMLLRLIRKPIKIFHQLLVLQVFLMLISDENVQFSSCFVRQIFELLLQRCILKLQKLFLLLEQFA